MRFIVVAAAALAMSTPVLADSALYHSDAVVATYSIVAPSSADFRRAQAELAAGRYADAARLLEPLADGSRTPATVLLTGYAHLGAGNFARAELYFERTLALDFGNPRARQGLGLAALARGDRGAAAEQLGKLEQARRACQRLCSHGSELDSAIASLRGAIG